MEGKKDYSFYYYEKQVGMIGIIEQFNYNWDKIKLYIMQQTKGRNIGRVRKYKRLLEELNKIKSRQKDGLEIDYILKLK